MSYWVYVIQGRDGELYKGMTSDLERRLEIHQRGFGRWTKGRGSFRLVLKEPYGTRKDAMTRERFLKSGKGREFLKMLVQHGK